MGDPEVQDIRAAIARLEAKVDDLRDLKPQVVANTSSISRVLITLHGADGRSGLLMDYGRIEQQMNAILVTVRWFGGTSVAVLAGILWKLVTQSG